MTTGVLLQLLDALGIKVDDYNGDWLQVHCPIAHLTHEDGDDEKASAGILVKEDSPVLFHCFACGTRTFFNLMHILYWSKGFDQKLFLLYLENEKFVDTETPIEYPEKYKKYEIPEPVPDYVMEKMEPLEKGKKYLDYRGIDFTLAKEHGLKFLSSYKTAQGKIWPSAIVTPIRDIDFKPYWLHFRSIQSKFFWHGKPEHFGCSIQWGRSDSWFGMEFLDITEPIYLVEGAFDCLRLKTLGVENVIAAHGGLGKKSKKLNRLLQMEPKLLYLGFDADKAGKGFKEVVKAKAQCETIDLDWSKVGIKDPGDLKSKSDLEKVKQKRNLEFREKYRRLHELV